MNHLARETSPYLLQHAGNPVDWYPWGEQALSRAKSEDKPLFLSIGYSACHWCHVMAHESFEDPDVAAILNTNFVSVKVDREERPDLDRIYMAAVQSLTGSGGWPLSVFLTPLGAPFYGGTYFPPVARFNLPSFKDVLLAVAAAWRDRRPDVVRSGAQLVQSINRSMGASPTVADRGALDVATLDAAAVKLRQAFDAALGGWGAAPKFPQPMALEFLLRHHHRTGDPQALHMVAHTLEAMARGGIYDQLGGGFHRYSVDARWLTPHFEKMLYDNAQLARVYLHAWQVTGNEFFRTITEEILDYVMREMTCIDASVHTERLRPEPQRPGKATDEVGGMAFYSAQDADSEGEEGKFFVWTLPEIRAVLGDQADDFVAAYGVTREGNFEGKNILEFVGTLEKRQAMADARRRLLSAREQRVHPGRDDKVLTSWNGLMMAAFAEAGMTLGRDDYLQAAGRNAEFTLARLRDRDGRLLRTWRAGEAKLSGYLEDYTHLTEGLLSLYQATLEPRWFTAARELAEQMLAHFSAPEGFYDTADDHEELIVRPRELQDNAVPSGNAMAAWVLQRLADLTLEERYADIARDSLRQVQSLLGQYPLGFAQWLIALDYALSSHEQVAIVGNRQAANTEALLATCTQGYRPHRLVALMDPDEVDGTVPLLRGREQIGGQATAYVCRGSSCQLPTASPEKLRELLS